MLVKEQKLTTAMKPLTEGSCSEGTYLRSQPDVVNAGRVLARETSVGEKPLAALLRGSHGVHVREVLLGNQRRVGGVGVIRVEVARQERGQVRAVGCVDSLDDVGRDTDLVGAGLGDGVVQVGVGHDHEPAGRDVLEDAHGDDAVASRVPALRGRVWGLGEPLCLLMDELEDVRLVYDWVVLPVALAVVPGHADVLPRTDLLHDVHNVRELVVQHFLHAHKGVTCRGYVDYLTRKSAFIAPNSGPTKWWNKKYERKERNLQSSLATPNRRH